MPRCSRRYWAFNSQAGFTLLETLVACAILVMAVSLSTPTMIMAIKDQKLLRDQTGRYESLRLPASIITQDVRQARDCNVGDWLLSEAGNDYAFESLRLSKNDGTTMVEYLFARLEKQPDGSVQAVLDRTNLHRWEGPKDVDGSMILNGAKDDIIASDMVFMDLEHSYAPFTHFGCAKASISSNFQNFLYAEAWLDTAAASGSAKVVELHVVAFPRQRTNW